jgi:hypothetical protein
MDLRNRRFRIWEYRVSHDQLLVRSPRAERHPRNVDVIFVGVEYLELATMFEGLEIAEPTDADLAHVRAAYKAEVRPDYVRVLVSQGRRYLVVAAGMKIEENELDLFESSLESFR